MRSKQGAVDEGRKRGKETTELEIGGGTCNITVVEEVANSVVVPSKINGVKGKAIMTHLEVGAAENVWVQAHGKTGPQKHVKERSWAQVAGSNRYDPLREVVAETQANEMKETNEELDMGPVTAAQAQPRVVQRPTSEKQDLQSG
ncbi:hypothetical protein FRX31_018412, partial [Thalictrum thalictroides]